MHIDIRISASPDELIAILQQLNIDKSSLTVNMINENTSLGASLNDKDRMIHIRNVVCKICELSHEQLVAKSKKRIFTEARFYFMYFTKKHTKLSHEIVGNFCGRRDHSSVSNAINTYNSLYSEKSNKSFINMADIIAKQLDEYFKIM